MISSLIIYVRISVISFFNITFESSCGLSVIFKGAELRNLITFTYTLGSPHLPKYPSLNAMFKCVICCIIQPCLSNILSTKIDDFLSANLCLLTFSHPWAWKKAIVLYGSARVTYAYERPEFSRPRCNGFGRNPICSGMLFLRSLVFC